MEYMVNNVYYYEFTDKNEYLIDFRVNLIFDTFCQCPAPRVFIKNRLILA